MLTQSISSLKGIGEKRAKAFLKLKITTVLDLLYFLPSRYNDFSKLTNVSDLQHGELAALQLHVDQAPQVLRPRAGLNMVKVNASDETGKLQLVWYNQPYRKNQISADEYKVFCGRADFIKNKKIVNPSIGDALPGILPNYPLVQGITQHVVWEAVRQAFKAIPELEETLPLSFREKYMLIGIEEAIRAVHFPDSMDMLSAARHRLAFEDMLIYFLAVAMLKKQRQDRQGFAFLTDTAMKTFKESLPFALTAAQKKVLLEIEADMQSNRPMNRLIQGDVGSGKTILAVFALYVAMQNGYQGVFMAPTEILAQQHYSLLQRTYGDRVLLLTGGLKKKEKDLAYARIASGEAAIIVGTHALLQPGLSFYRLGLVVTDEQHRFGVRQRAILAHKGDYLIDVLVMSATPIPRTLAMLLYGDLDISVLNEMPPGRRPALTRLVPQDKREDMYRFLSEQAQNKKQAYVVCPLVEQSEVMEIKSAEEVYKELCLKYPLVKFALLHGRMAAIKKQEVIEGFRKGDTDVLVSTTVVEVGVDVPNATIMVIENAERFGLAQLHQLRGRVGRGSDQSYCFLMSGSQGETIMERLGIMTKTNDGFIIAQKDLEIRGPGEFLGTRQHGDYEKAALQVDMDVLFEAQNAAAELMQAGEAPEFSKVYQKAGEIYHTRMAYIANN